MSEEQKTQEVNPNQAKEVSILMRNLRLLKRLVLGKKQPPFFLKILSWVFFTWSLLMIIGFLFIGVGGSIFDVFNNDIKDSAELTPKYFYTYAVLHMVSLLGVILMYRKKLTGFYIFGAANLLMPFWAMIITKYMTINWYVVLFSVVSIGLFAINWNKFQANVRKKEKALQNQE